MLELNKTHLCDCIEGLKSLDDNSIDLIITSPPYNKKGFTGRKQIDTDKSLWNSVISYDNFDDDMPEDEYQKWQVEFLNECFRVLKPTGSMFYNHKVRINNGVGSIPFEWICKSKFIFRQLITWNRKSTTNVNPSYFLPVSEQIYWLTKSNKDVRFNRMSRLTDVLDISVDTKNNHPAPFPVDLPDIIIQNVLGDKKMRATLGNIIVLDPFMGSGTTAIASIKNGCDWLGFEISEKYLNMSEQRIQEYKSTH